MASHGILGKVTLSRGPTSDGEQKSWLLGHGMESKNQRPDPGFLPSIPYGYPSVSLCYLLAPALRLQAPFIPILGERKIGRTYVLFSRGNGSLCVCVTVCICVYKCVYVCVLTCECVYVCMCVNMCMCVHVYVMCVHVCTCQCAYMCTCVICMYV